MYQLIENILGYNGTSNIQSNIIYIAGALICIFFAITLDMLYKIFLRFFPNNLR